jgi:hypothetical protein
MLVLKLIQKVPFNWFFLSIPAVCVFPQDPLQRYMAMLKS